MTPSTSDCDSRFAVGIDPGMTYTKVAVWKDGEALPHLVRDVERDTFAFRSWVDSSGRVGAAAAPDNSAFDVKRCLGRGYDECARMFADLGRHPEEVVRMPDGSARFRFPLAARQHKATRGRAGAGGDTDGLAGTATAAELWASLLGEARRLAAVRVGVDPASIERAVVAVPVNFGPAQIDACREAALLAGLTDVEFVTEPVAAALSYLPRRAGMAQQSTPATLDLGGGTSDLSVTSFRYCSARVLAQMGRDEGGRNVDAVVQRCLVNELEEMIEEAREAFDDKDLDEVPVEGLDEDHRRLRSLLAFKDLDREAGEFRGPGLAQLAERVKIDLASSRPVAASITVNFGISTASDGTADTVKWTENVARAAALRGAIVGPYSMTLSYSQLVGPIERVVTPIVEEMWRLILSFEKDIDHILVVGGTCRLEAVRAKLRSLVAARRKVASGFNPAFLFEEEGEERVCVGAAVFAGIRDHITAAQALDLIECSTKHVGVLLSPWRPDLPMRVPVSRFVGLTVTPAEKALGVGDDTAGALLRPGQPLPVAKGFVGTMRVPKLRKGHPYMHLALYEESFPSSNVMVMKQVHEIVVKKSSGGKRADPHVSVAYEADKYGVVTLRAYLRGTRARAGFGTGGTGHLSATAATDSGGGRTIIATHATATPALHSYNRGRPA